MSRAERIEARRSLPVHPVAWVSPAIQGDNAQLPQQWFDTRMECFPWLVPGERSFLKQCHPQPFLRTGDSCRTPCRAGAYDNDVKVIHRDVAMALHSGG